MKFRRPNRARRADSFAHVAVPQFESIESRIMMAVSPTSDLIRAAIQRAADTTQYTQAKLASARQWAMTVSSRTNIKSLRVNLGATSLTPSGLISDVYVATFPNSVTGQVAAKRIQQFNLNQFAWPLIAKQQTPRFIPNDPRFAQQWHLQNTGQGGGLVGADANVVTAWDQYLGDGVMLGIVDDGVTPLHEDLAPNYVAAHSFDFNNNDPDPSGGSHGTSVAGVAGAKGNNKLGVSGAAPNAQHAGLRLIAGPSSDSQEASALAYHMQDIDIYNNSWGPSDNGLTLEGPGPLTLAAWQNAVVNGRGGLGNIWVWAGGNGGDGDNVNFDGYANHRYIIAVGAINNFGDRSSFSERGASLLVGAYSAGGSLGINTTSPGGYTTGFGGTSAASPLAAGVIALMLDANPNLTWRDVQHILVHSAEKVDPTDPGWGLNGAGHDINDKFGYGGIDAAAAVALAENWTTVASEASATTGTINVNQAIPDNNVNGITSQFTVTDAIKLETVEIVFNASHLSRGQLRVLLTSPSGTVSELATQRNDTGDNFNNWVFTTKRNWDEDARGTWTIKVIDAAGGTTGTFNNWKMNLYGTNLSTTPTIYGTVYDDTNGSNTRDAGEPGIANVPVYDDLDGDGELDAGEPNTTSNGSGGYALTDLTLGLHAVRAVTPAGLRAGQGSTPYSIDLTESQNYSTGNNFGFINPRIDGTVIDDDNDNGVIDLGETGLAGVTVYLDIDESGTFNDGDISTTTAANGSYSLDELADGSYTVRAVTPAGRRLTAPGGGSHGATIASGSLVHTGKTFAMTDRVRITGAVYTDKNGNGANDSETGLSNVRVYHDLNLNGQFDNTGGTFASIDVPKAINDNSTVLSNLTISGGGNINNITVKINITHTYDGDLDIFLISPAGTRVELTTDNGDTGENFIDTVFDDAAANSITAGSAPFTGSWRPETPLSALNGQSANGTWKLEITDDAGQDVGTLTGWSITYGSTEPNQLTNASGGYAFALLNPGSYSLREVLPANHVLTSPTSGEHAFSALGGELLTADFGNFATAYAGSDITLSLDPTGTNVQIWVDEPTTNPPTYTADKTIIPSLSFTGTAGDDSLTVDSINGDPIPAGSVTFDGLGEASLGDVYVIKGSTANEDVLFSNTGANVNGLLVNITSVERARFDGRGGGDDLIVNGGPTVVIGNTQHLTSLGVIALASASVEEGSNAVIVTNAFQINGIFDLNDNDMIVNYGVLGGSVLGDVQALINSARNGGTWDGATGFMSTSAKNRTPRNTTLAAMESVDYKGIYGIDATFDGEALPVNAVLIKYTYYGDADFNGVVNFDDYSRADAGFNSGASGWLNGDFDGNGSVNFDDYSLIDLAFNSQLGAL